MRQTKLFYLIPVFFTFFLAGNINAQQRYVDPLGVCGGNTPCYTSISAAVAAAVANDTLILSNATHVDAAQVVIDKDLTMRSASGDRDLVIITKNFDTGSGGDARGWYLVNSGIRFDVRNLTFDGTGFLTWQAIRSNGDNAIDNVVFTDIDYNSTGPAYAGTAIVRFGTAGALNISDSDFNNIGRIGAQYFGAGTTGSFIGNTYTGKGDGDFLDYALDINAGAVVTVSQNTVSENRGVASSDGSTSAGFLVTTFFGPGTDVNFSCNTMINNSTGLFVGFNGADVSTVVANNNNFQGNGFGLRSTAPPVNGENNYWGSPDGPSGAGPGTGDPVDTEVDFDPFLGIPSACAPQIAGITASIPTMSQWALFLFGLSVFTLGIIVVYNVYHIKNSANS